MNLLELKSNIDDLVKQVINYGHREPSEVEVLINLHQPSIGAGASVGIKNIYEGFDWEMGQVRIVPERAICDKYIFNKDKDIGYLPSIHSTVDGKSNYFCSKCMTKISKKDNYCKNCGCKINKKDFSKINNGEVFMLIRFLTIIKNDKAWIDKNHFITTIDTILGNSLKKLFIELNGDNSFNNIDAYNNIINYLELPFIIKFKNCIVKDTINVEKWYVVEK